MTKQETAAFLGVGIRTLERYTSTKKIPARYEKTDGQRRTLVYEKDDLERFVKERQVTLKKAPAPSPKSDTLTISFRVDPSTLQRLQQAGEPFTMSAGEYARHLVLRGLEGGESEAIALRREVKALKENLAEGVVALLVDAGRATPEAAQAWVAKRFK
jgi:hypothetical protein